MSDNQDRRIAKLEATLECAYVILASAFNRIESLPRCTDGDLARRISQCRAQIELNLKPEVDIL
jgi:hypothetical protein